MGAFRKITLADLYALIALGFGIFFIAATPPFGAGDETAHFERAYEIAAGKFMGAEGVPAGMQDLMDDAFGRVKSGEAVTGEDYARWSRYPLRSDEITPWPEPVRVVMRLHSPFCYAHLAPVAAVGVALGLPPLEIFYLGRLAALLAGVFLVRAAISRAPSTLRAPLVAIALLPTAIVYFSAFNIESLLVGAGFYFFAIIASLAATPEEKINRGDIIRLAAFGFLLGQFKTAYLLAPFAALVLPATIFENARQRLSVLALTILPGAATSLVWAMAVKTQMIDGLVYSTMDGNRVDPSAQLAGVLADPIGYLGVLARTVFASDMPGAAWQSFLGLAGWSNIAVPAPVYALLTLGLILVWLSGEKAPPALTTRFALATQISVFAATTLAILTLVYFQWDGVGDKVIVGFQGRYFLAIAPLLIAAAPVRLSLMAAPGRREAAAVGIPLLGLLAMAAAVTARYF
ncbi:MAG: DUF2142 domain-containing protein [Parvularculaceae bacterium]